MKKLYFLLFARVRTFFGFTAGESHGFLILMVLMLFVAFLPLAFSFIPSKVDEAQELADQRKLDSLVQVLDKIEESSVPKSTYSKSLTKTDAKLFEFDPNLASTEEFESLGLPKFLAERIVKYRSKGGKFKKADDFAKVYGLRESDFERLLPYIKIGSKSVNQNFTKKEERFEPKASQKTFPKTDINLADSAQWVRVRGIGAVLANRIIKFRAKLGGFVSLEQIKEVYGLDSMVVQTIQKQFFIADSFKPTSILINGSDYKTLASHPYIGGKLAGVILNYKKQHGPYKSISDLEKIQLMDVEKLVKLKPYLSFEE